MAVPLLAESVTGLFRVTSLRAVSADLHPSLPRTPVAPSQSGYAPQHPETVLLLHTSGTSGNKKLVPYSLEMLVVGVACIALSWRLVCVLMLLLLPTLLTVNARLHE